MALSTRDEVEYADVAVDAVCDHEDKAVLAVVESCNAGTSYDPLLEVDPVELPPVRDDVEATETDFASPGLLSPVSADITIDPPDDFTVVGSLAAQSVSETAASVSDAGPEDTSPMGLSLIDSHDELIASRLPGYLNSF